FCANSSCSLASGRWSAQCVKQSCEDGRGPPSRLSEVSRGSHHALSPRTCSEEVRRRTSMTVQEALNKATEGGYHIYGSDGMDTYYEGANSEYSVWTRKDNESSFIVPTEETFLDPRFWQALGHALGWSAVCDLAIICVHGEEECQSCRGYYWM